MCLTEEVKVSTFPIQRGADAADHGNIDSLINPHILIESGIFFHDVPCKFGGNKFIERKGPQTPLKHLPSRSKNFLEPMTDATSPPSFKIIDKSM